MDQCLILCGVSPLPTTGNVKRLKAGSRLAVGEAQRLFIYSVHILSSIGELWMRMDSWAQTEHALLRLEVDGWT